MKTKKDYRRRRENQRKHKTEIYENRAVLEDRPNPFQDVTDTSCCLEELVFAMQDNHHTFSMGLSTVLSCLAIAEKEGYVPKLPYEWWASLRRL
ncbi:MAG: hypothetical protein AAGU32_06595 [Bacillota bacterium]